MRRTRAAGPLPPPAGRLAPQEPWRWACGVGQDHAQHADCRCGPKGALRHARGATFPCALGQPHAIGGTLGAVFRVPYIKCRGSPSTVATYGLHRPDQRTHHQEFVSPWRKQNLHKFRLDAKATVLASNKLVGSHHKGDSTAVVERRQHGSHGIVQLWARIDSFDPHRSTHRESVRPRGGRRI